MDDFASTDAAVWVEHQMNMAAGDAVETITNNDNLHIAATFDNGAAVDEYCYYERNITNISSSTYTKYLLRYRTSAASAAAQAKAVLIFTSGTQTILDLNYSTSWKLASGTITSGKTVDKIQLWADDDGVDGSFWVEYDYIMLYKDNFTLPNTAYGYDIDLLPREAIIAIPSKDTDATQNLGTQSIPIHISCDLDQETTTYPWKRADDTFNGEVFWDIWHNRSSEPFQWFNDGTRQFKVSIHPRFRWENRGNAAARRLDLELREYSLGDKSEETYLERFGIGL